MGLFSSGTGLVSSTAGVTVEVSAGVEEIVGVETGGEEVVVVDFLGLALAGVESRMSCALNVQ